MSLQLSTSRPLLHPHRAISGGGSLQAPSPSRLIANLKPLARQGSSPASKRYAALGGAIDAAASEAAVALAAVDAPPLPVHGGSKEAPISNDAEGYSAIVPPLQTDNPPFWVLPKACRTPAANATKYAMDGESRSLEAALTRQCAVRASPRVEVLRLRAENRSETQQADAAEAAVKEPQEDAEQRQAERADAMRYGDTQCGESLAVGGGNSKNDAWDVSNRVKAVVMNGHVQATAAGVAGGAVAVGTSGMAAGGALGAVVGLVPALFTFGMSVPIGATLGAGAGLAAGATVGAFSGGAAGYGIYSKRDKFKELKIKLRNATFRSGS